MATEPTAAQKRTYALARRILRAGFGELGTHMKAVISALEAKDAKAASKAFEAMYRKAASMENGFSVAHSKVNKEIFNNGLWTAVFHFHHMLSTVAGGTRESQDLVISQATVESEERCKDIIALLNEFQLMFAEQLDIDEKSAKFKLG